MFNQDQDLLHSIFIFEKGANLSNKNIFGNIFAQLRKINAMLAGIQKSYRYPYSTYLQSLETKLVEHYDTLLRAEQEFWQTKPRINWLSDEEC